MDDNKPNTLTASEADLRMDRQSGDRKLADRLQAALASGATAGLEQADGSVTYFSDAEAFQAHLANL